MKPNMLMKGSFAVTLMVLVAAVYSIRQNTPVSIPQEPLQQPASRVAVGTTPTDLQKACISAIGIVEPSSEAIAVAGNVSGVVTRVFVRPGIPVKRGEPLWTVDSSTARAELEVSKAELRVAQNKLAEMESQAKQIQARVESARAAVRTVQAEKTERVNLLKRTEQLWKRSAASEEEFSTRQIAVEVASARLADAEAKLEEAQATMELLIKTLTVPVLQTKVMMPGPTLDVQQAAVQKAKTLVQQAENRLALCTVSAPGDGIILQVRIREGEFATAAVLSEPLVIMGVIDPLHVRVDIDESEIYRFQPHANAYATLRGQSSRRLDLKLVRVEPLVIPKRSLNGTASERVDTRVMQVIYRLHSNPQTVLVGQQVDVYIEE